MNPTPRDTNGDTLAKAKQFLKKGEIKHRIIQGEQELCYDMHEVAEAFIQLQENPKVSTPLSDTGEVLKKIKAIPYMKLTYGEENYVIDTNEIAEAFIALSEDYDHVNQMAKERIEYVNKENETLRIEHGMMKEWINQLKIDGERFNEQPVVEAADKILSQITL